MSREAALLNLKKYSKQPKESIKELIKESQPKFDTVDKVCEVFYDKDLTDFSRKFKTRQLFIEYLQKTYNPDDEFFKNLKKKKP